MRFFCSLAVFKPQMIKLSRGNLLWEKSVTLANLSFPRETVNKSSFPRKKSCSVTTAIVLYNFIVLSHIHYLVLLAWRHLERTLRPAM